MGYTPAVRVTCFARDPEHRADRRKKLSERLGLSAQVAITHELVDRIGESETRQWSLSDSPHGLPLLELRLFVNHPDHKHENVCLENERSLISNLLHDRLVDVADFPRGLPKKNPGRLSRKYELGTIDGMRPFVALALLRVGLFPELAALSSSLERFLATSWAILEGDCYQVSLTRVQRLGFELECANLSYFHGLKNIMAAAAKKL